MRNGRFFLSCMYFFTKIPLLFSVGDETA